MLKELEQKRMFGRKKFRLNDNNVEIYDKKINEEIEFSVDYLDLGVDTVKKSIKNSMFVELFFWAFFLIQFGLLIESLVFESENKGMLVFWSLGSGFFLGMIFLIRWQPGKKLIYLTGGQKSIEFFQEKPNKKAVETFIGELKNRIRKAYKNEYLKWEDKTPVEQKIGQLEWLKRIKILDENDFEEFMRKVKNDKPIGFNKTE